MRIRRSRIGASIALDPAANPAVTSAWPFKYFVAEWSTRSNPSASGCWRTGEAKVPSTTAEIPRRRAIPPTCSRSTILTRGLVGVST